MSPDKTQSDVSPSLPGDFRMTRQRREVFDTLLESQDHPTATELFIRCKQRMPQISLATVYNCLETLTQCGLIKQVNLDRAPSRYCGKMHDHVHFFCHQCGKVTDADPVAPFKPDDFWKIEPKALVTQFEGIIKGICSDCHSAPDQGSQKSPEIKNVSPPTSSDLSSFSEGESKGLAH